MAGSGSDGFYELAFNSDETQVFANIYPPKGTGAAVTVESVVARLKQMGVMYGIREAEIAKSIAQACSTNGPVTRTVVAQGVLPVEGTDAQIQWVVDYASAACPLPRHTCGALDLLTVHQSRLVKAGMVIATVKPGIPGSMGKTLKAPYRTILACGMRDVPYIAGTGVSYSSDKQQFASDVNGILEIRSDTIVVHPVEWVDGDLINTVREFNSGVVIRGDMTASTIRASGPVVVSGTVAGCMIRAKGDVVVSRCARTQIIANGDVYSLCKLLHCKVVTPQRAIVADGALLLGGAIYATLGIRAVDVGAAEGVATLLASAVDHYTPFRQQEVETEITQHEDNIQKIARVLRPLTTAAQEGAPEQKRQLVQTLSNQRRNLEVRVRELHHEKRNLLLASKSRVDAEICVAGTIYRGVTVQLDNAAFTLEETRRSVRFVLDAVRESVLTGPFVELLVA